MDLPPLIFILAGLYVGWSIGANDVANAIGPPVGSGLISYRKAVMLFAIFAVVGGVIGGHAVMKTVGVDMASKIPDVPLLIAMLVSAILVTLTSRFGIPVSASQSIVSGLTGAALASGVPIDRSLGTKILLTWFTLPVAAVILAPTLYSLMKIPMRRVNSLYRSERILGALLLVGSCYISFSIGANNAGNAMGPIIPLNIAPVFMLGLLGGFAIAIGALTSGKHVVATVGGGITPLDPLSSFAVQLSSGIGIHLLSLLGIPVSTTHAVIGSVVGVGVTNGIRTVRKRKLVKIAACWILTPVATFVLVFIAVRMI